MYEVGERRDDHLPWCLLPSGLCARRVCAPEFDTSRTAQLTLQEHGNGTHDFTHASSRAHKHTPAQASVLPPGGCAGLKKVELHTAEVRHVIPSSDVRARKITLAYPARALGCLLACMYDRHLFELFKLLRNVSSMVCSAEWEHFCKSTAGARDSTRTSSCAPKQTQAQARVLAGVPPCSHA